MNHPHDKLFKATFSQPDVVASLIEDLFPPALVAEIDVETLVLTTNSYIDNDLKEHFADLVYQCQFSNQVPFEIALLLEHKSYPDKHPHLQLLRYMLNRWQQDAQTSQGLAPIVPVLIYHGTAPWPHRSLEAQMVKMHPELKPYLPEFDYVLIDLSRLDDTQILSFRSQFLALSASLLKYHEENKHVEFIRQHIMAMLSKVAEADLRSIIEPTFLYLLETSNLTGHEIVAIFSRVSKQTQDVAMTAADQLRLEGRLEGRTEGRVEATYKFVKGALKLGMDAKTIASTFELDIKEVEAIINVLRQ
jgi:predicted transposase/invertase (TIGR01784 family)